MIVHGVIYNGEKELLEILLNETKLFNQDVITVIICASETHTGWKKPTYEEHLLEFKKFNIFACALDKLEGKTPREREAYQRNSIKEVIRAMPMKNDDIVIISDIDEIPRARAVNLFPAQLKFAALIQDKYAFFLNNIESEQSWDRARIMTWEYLRNKEPEEVRNSGYDFSIHHAGWHWSWVIDPLRKLESFSHQELNTQANFEKIERKENIWDDSKFKVIDINLSHPEYLYKNQDKFSHLICKQL